jgi:hypothetical protein
MSDEAPLSRRRTIGELLFEFYRERDSFALALRATRHGETYGVEQQFFQNDEFIIGRRFDRTMDPTPPPRDLANLVDARMAEAHRAPTPS